MFQAITDKAADYAAPLIAGLAIWYGAHYVIFTPRILMVDLPKQYVHELRHQRIPSEAVQCGQSAIVSETLSTARWQAALHTASFGHVTGYFRGEQLAINERINRRCGVSAAIARNEALKAQKEAANRRAIEQQARFNDSINTLGTIFALGKALTEESER